MIMIVKTSCQHCGIHIEFDAESANLFVPCPSCTKQTQLLLPSQTAHSKPPPKASAPTPATNDPQPVSRIRRGWFSICLQAITTAAVVFMAVLFWLHEQAANQKPGWQYDAFEYQESPGTDNEGHRYRNMLVFMDHGKSAVDLVAQEPQEEPSADAILNRLANDGWELAWTDGAHFIVKRQNGAWRHPYFYVCRNIVIKSAAKP